MLLIILDARTKLVCVLLLTLLVFMIDQLPAAALLVVSFFVIRLSAKIPFRGWKSLKNLTLLAAIIVMTQTLFAPGDSYIVKSLVAGFGSLKWEGFFLGITIVCRLCALLLLLPVFTETTPASRIAAGLCSMGFNYRSAFIITTAFNLIPFFREEANRVMDAQKLRGSALFAKKSFFSAVKAYSGLLIPLMLGAMRKARSSSVAMDSRAFGIYKTRTWIDKPRMKKADFWVLAFCLVFFAGMLFFNYNCEWYNYPR